MTTPDTAPDAAYAAVDWGTSSFRLWLIGKDGGVLAERRSGEGMTTAARTGFAEVLQGHLAAVSAPADLPVLICGMAGARGAWVEAPYGAVPCPPSPANPARVPTTEPRLAVRKIHFEPLFRAARGLRNNIAAAQP